MNANDQIITANIQPIDSNPATIYLSKFNDKAKRVQGNALRTIAIYLTGNDDIFSLNWASLRYSHCAIIRSKLANDYSVASTNRMLSALRGVLKAAFLNDLMDAKDYQKAISIENVKGSTLPKGRELKDDELTRLMKVCIADKTIRGIRDAAIVSVLFITGMRREEIVNALYENYNNDDGSIRIIGKGNEERYVYIADGAYSALNEWLNVRGNQPGALFQAITKYGKLRKGKLNAQTVYDILANRATQAGLEHFSPHDLRRTCITKLLSKGIDTFTVQKIANHKSPLTTARYDKRPEESKRKAISQLTIYYDRE